MVVNSSSQKPSRGWRRRQRPSRHGREPDRRTSLQALQALVERRAARHRAGGRVDRRHLDLRWPRSRRSTRATCRYRRVAAAAGSPGGGSRCWYGERRGVAWAKSPTYSILAAPRSACRSSATSFRLRSLSRNCSIAGVACVQGDRLRSRRRQVDDLNAARANVEDRLAVFHLGELVDARQRQLLGGPNCLVAGVAIVVGLQVSRRNAVRFLASESAFFRVSTCSGLASTLTSWKL